MLAGGTAVERAACVKGRTPAGQWGAAETLVGVAKFLVWRASDYVSDQMI